MTKATRTTETTNTIFEMTLTRDVIDDVSYADGYNIVTGRKVYECYETKVTIKATGKTIHISGLPEIYKGMPKGAYARFGDAYMSKDAYDVIMQLAADLDAANPKSDEQIAIENRRAAEKAAANAYYDSDEYRRHIAFQRRMEDPDSDL